MFNKVLLFSLFLILGFAHWSVAQKLSLEQLEKEKRYKSLEEALKEPDKVLVLDLSEAGIVDLPAAIGQFPNLQLLDLRSLYQSPTHVKLTTLPNELGNCKNLQFLYLYHNPLPESEVEKVKKLIPDVFIGI